MGEAGSSADVAAIYQPLVSIITCVLSIMLGWEKATVRRICGVLLSVGGVSSAMVWKGFEGSSGSLAANLMLIVNVCSGAGYFLFQKPIVHCYDPLAITTIAYVFAALTALLVCLPSFFLQSMNDQAWTVSGDEWKALIFSVISAIPEIT